MDWDSKPLMLLIFHEFYFHPSGLDIMKSNSGYILFVQVDDDGDEPADMPSPNSPILLMSLIRYNDNIFENNSFSWLPPGCIIHI